MKAIQNISLTLLLITLTSTLSAAGNIRTFQSQLNNGKSISVVSKLESLLEESVPGFENFVNQFNSRNTLVRMEVQGIQETILEEELAEISDFNASNHSSEAVPMLRVNSKEEPVIEEDAYSMAIMNAYNASMPPHAEDVNIKSFMKAEKELLEEICIFARTNFTAK